MARGTDRCGGGTSSAGISKEYGNQTLASRLPRGCLVGDRRPRHFADGPKYGWLAACESRFRLSSAQIISVRLRTDAIPGRQITPV